jgi:cytochrome c-type biogenesis protein CcmH
MMLGFWLTAAALTLVAVAFLLVPLARERRRNGRTPITGLVAAIAVVPASVGLYFVVSTFDSNVPPSAAQEQMALLDRLAARLSADPSDVDGWVLLGRSYIELGDFAQARLALEEAWKRTAAPDDLLKIAYAQTLLFTEEGAALGLAGDLVEDVLESSPGNSNALLWGGFVAAERNQPAVAAERWTALLATNPPPDIADLLRNQIALLGDAAAGAQAAGDSSGPVVNVTVSLAESVALDDFGPTAQLFVIASATDSPAPVAVERHPLSALPGSFALSDADAMIPNRKLSLYDEVTVIARISRSGEPTAQPGDVYDEMTVDPRTGETVDLVIEQVVP